MLNVSTPFAYYVGSEKLEFDFTELRKDPRNDFRISGQKGYNFDDTKDLSTREYHDKFYRVLDSHPSLKTEITKCFNLFLKEIYGPLEARIVTSWINTLKDGDSIALHRHTNCFYSGVLYYGEHYEKKASKLWLINPLKNTLHNFIPKEYNPDKHNATQDDIFTTPSTGALYFFPSNIYHEAPIHKGLDRSCLAFNFVINEIWNNDSSQTTWK